MEEWKILKQVYLQVCLLYVTGLQVRSSQLCENIPMGRNFIDVQVQTYMILTLHFLNVYMLLSDLVSLVHFTFAFLKFTCWYPYQFTPVDFILKDKTLIASFIWSCGILPCPFGCRGTLLNALWWPEWEGNPKGRGYVYVWPIHFAVQ